MGNYWCVNGSLGKIDTTRLTTFLYICGFSKQFIEIQQKILCPSKCEKTYILILFVYHFLFASILKWIMVQDRNIKKYRIYKEYNNWCVEK